MSPELLRKIANFVWFQSIWLLVIVYQYEWLWLVCALIASFFFITDDRRTELAVIVAVAMTGLCVDSALTLFGVFIFTSPTYGMVIPVWLLALWVAFAGTLRHSLRYFMGNWWLCIGAGAVSGPLSYLAGNKFGAVTFGFPLFTTMAIISVVWASVLPLSFWLTMQIESRWQKVTVQ